MSSIKVSDPIGSNYNEIISTRPFLPPSINSNLITKESYIPFEFAQNKINEINSDVNLLKFGYENYINKLKEYQKNFENEIKLYYENYIKELKLNAKKCLNYEKELNKNHIIKLENNLKDKEIEMDSLRDVYAVRINDYQNTIHKLKNDIIENHKNDVNNNLIRNETSKVLNDIIVTIEKNDKQLQEKKLKNNYKKQIEKLTNQTEENYFIRNETSKILNEILIKIEVKNEIIKNKKIMSLESKLNEINVNKNELAIENNLQNENLNNLNKMLENKNQIILDIKNQILKSVAQRNVEDIISTANIHEAKTKMTEINLHLNNVQAQLTTQKQENNQLEQLIEKLKQENEQLQKQNDEQKNLIQQFIQKESSLNENITNFQTQTNDLQQQSTDLQNQLNDIKQQSIDFQQQINDLQQKLKEQNEIILLQNEEIFIFKQRKPIVVVNNISSSIPDSTITTSSSSIPLSTVQVESSKASPSIINRTLSGPPVDIISRQLSKNSIETTTITAPEITVDVVSAQVIETKINNEPSEELLLLQERYEDLKIKLQNEEENEKQYNELKVVTKNDIKKWMKEFEKANGRPPNNEEKSSVKEKFVKHKQANEAATKSTEEVERLRTEIAQIEEHIKLLKDNPSRNSNNTDNNNNININQEQQQIQVQGDGTYSLQDNNNSVVISSTELDELKQNYSVLQQDYEKLKELHQLREKEISNLQIDNQDLLTRLENIRNEKRTDLVARLETEGEELRKKLQQNLEEISSFKTERVKQETKIKELKERAEVAEKELHERDEREIQQIPHDQETVALKTQVSKQRDEIVMKSKAATAGWDAAANAEEKLETEVDRAYAKGLAEGKKIGVSDFQSIHTAIEAKEQKIIELIEKCADSDKRAIIAEKEMEDALQKLMTANHYVEMIKSQQQNNNNNGNNGNGNIISGDQIMSSSSYNPNNEANEEKINELEEQLEKTKDRLEETQEEMINLSEQVEELRHALDISEQKIKLLEQMVSTQTSDMSAISSSIPLSNNSSNAEMKSSKGGFADGIISQIRITIEKGTKLWNEGKRDECYDFYDTTLSELQNKLKTSALKDPIGTALLSGRGQKKRPGALVLRKALDALVAGLEDTNKRNAEENAQGGSGVLSTTLSKTQMQSPSQLNSTINASSVEMDALRKQLNSLNATTTTKNLSSTTREGGNAILVKRLKEAESEIEELKSQLANLERFGGGNNNNNMGGGKSVGKSGGSGGNDSVEVKNLQKRIKELESQLNSGGGGGGGAAEKKAVAAVEKKYEKQAKELEKVTRKEKAALESRVSQLEGDLEQITRQCNEAETERDQLRQRVKELGNANSEMEALRAKAAQVDQLNEIINQNAQQLTQLTAQYKKEAQLRKQYKNELEDLKGAIRVYARVRPMAQYEIERNCNKIVEFPDETSVRVHTSRGDKEFEFDAAFTDLSTQEQVFEDTRRLVESFLDGFNVCLFAYGQTGSGKTFTMTGSESMPGLTPRAINEMFRLITERTHCTSRVSTYFVELYNDNLVDLYWLLDNKRGRGEPPKLDIKLNDKKMVFIKNAIIKDVGSASELMELFRLGNLERHVGATKMNAESSRSHSIFAIMCETYDSTTKKTVTGKLSLVDLAGSERADKTGASAERLREAQSINKSLSALGDVISALSEGEKFIPYRNNKLTQLMQDSLGGNAKTLMFVNFSPADYNADETVTSLSYATRVKKITNNASKQAESEEIAKLKAMIKKLQGGGTIEEEPADQNDGGGDSEHKE